jgi:predicted transcriptional regulator
MVMESANQDDLVQLTADIVSAFVSNNTISSGEIGKLIEEVHVALKRAPDAAAAQEPERRDPAVPVRRSVTPEYIISLEDGRKFKSLKRHLMNTYGLTPDQYRQKWGLPRDYPMVAPNYAKARSDLAKSMGLGRKRDASDASKAGGSRRGRGRRGSK